MEAKEITKFAGMEQLMALPPSTLTHTQKKKEGLPLFNPPPLSPPAVLLTDGGKGGWVDGLRGLKTLRPHFGAHGVSLLHKVGCGEALVARMAGRMEWARAG